MKQRFLFALAATATLAFSSCKKNDPAPNNPGTEKRLKKVTKTEGATVTVYNLSYNAAGKLVSYKSTDNKEFISFSYDAAGNLNGIEQQDQDFKNIYVYNYVNNVPVSGTFKSWDISNGLPGTLIEDDVLAYTVTNNQVSKIKLTMQGAGETNFTLSYSNGDLTKVVTDGFILMLAEFTYGNKKPVYPKVTSYVLDQAGFSLQFAASHEITKTFFDFPGTANDLTINTTYTYDTNGYVLTSNDGSEQLVYEYE